LVPPRPTDLGGVRALAGGRHHPTVDVEQIAVRVEAELRLDPRPAPGRDVLVPDHRRLDVVAVAFSYPKHLYTICGPPTAPPFRSIRYTSDRIVKSAINATTRLTRALAPLASRQCYAGHRGDAWARPRDRAGHGRGRRRRRHQRT